MLTTTTTPAPLRPFFAIHHNDNYADGKREPLPPLFATYTARDGTRHRVRCVTASKLGRVGITESLTHDAPAREFVPAGSLSQFMPTPYPERRPPAKQVVGVIAARIHADAKVEAAKIVAAISKCPVGIDRVVAQVTTACGLAVADIGGSGRTQLLTAARRMLFGKLAARHPDLSSRDIHRLSNTTYAFAEPVAKSGYLSEFSGFGLNGGGTVALKRFTKSGTPGVISPGDVMTQIGPDYPVAVPAGAFALGSNGLGPIPVNAGEYLGVHPGTATRYLGATVIAGPGFCSATVGTGNVSTFAVASVSAASRLELSYKVRQNPAASSIAVAAQMRAPLDEALLSLSTTQRIGAPGTPISATALPDQVNVLAQPIAATGRLLAFDVFALAAGIIRFKRFTKTGDVFDQVGPDYLIPVSPGLNQLKMRDFGVIPVVAGEYPGLYGPPILGRTSASGSWPAIYNGATGNLSSFTDASAAAGLRVEAAMTFGAVTVSESRVGVLESSLANTIFALGEALTELGAYTPALAFARFHGCWFDFSDRKNIFTDAIGATPATADGQLVRRVRDKSGHGYDFVVTADSLRPAYKVAGEGGRSFLRFTGNEGLEGLKKGLTRNRAKITFLCVDVTNPPSGASRPAVFFSLGTSVGTRLSIGQATSGLYGWPAAAARRISGETAKIALTPRAATDRAVVSRSDFLFADGIIKRYRNGSQGPEGIVEFDDAGNSDDTDEVLTYIGGYSGTPITGFIGDLYEVVGLIDADDDTVEAVSQYLISKYNSIVDAAPAAPYDPTGLIPAAWTWFNDPRVIMLSDGKFVVGGVTSVGSVIAGVYDYAAGTHQHHILTRALQQDDHNNPGFVELSDGKIMALYSIHSEGVFYSAKTTASGDASAWDAAINITDEIRSSAASQKFTYSNPVRLEGESGRIYNFIRNIPGDTGIATLNITWSDDDGTNWTPLKQLLSQGRPYFKIKKTSGSRIDILCNSGHPDEWTDCSTFHFYYQGGSFYKTDSTLIGAIGDLPFNQNTQLTTVWDAASQAQESWVWDVTTDPVTSLPVAGFATFSKPDLEHTYHYYKQGRWTGSAWDIKAVCDGGGTLYTGTGTYADQFQVSYSGGMVIDPDDINVVYCSRQVDAEGLIDLSDNGVHHLFKCVTSDVGATWVLTQLTFGSEKHFRPFIPAGSRRLFFSRGRYDSYGDYRTFIDSIEIM